jgi:hypothetical protein
VVRAWNHFFFEPQSPTPIGIYRIFYGLLVIADLVLLYGDWLVWYGTHGLVTTDTYIKISGGVSLNLLLIMPQTDAWVQAFFWVFLLFAVFLTAGFMSRFSSVVVFLCLGSIQRRNWYILHSGDTLLMATGFFLIFAPTGAAISIDRLLRIWHGKEGPENRLYSPWAQRMLQIQTSMVYISTFCWKTLGAQWMDGTALYYTMRLAEFQRFPVPALENGILLRLATWSTLFVEFAAGVLVWIRKLRYWILLLGVCLHLSIEYSMNIPLFQWIIMAGYINFVDPADLTRFWSWLRRRFANPLGARADVIYDCGQARSSRLANILRTLDVFGRLNIIGLNSCPEIRSIWLSVSEEAEPTLVVRARGAVYKDSRGLLAISRLVPLLWPLAPVSFMSTIPKPQFRVAKATK